MFKGFKSLRKKNRRSKEADEPLAPQRSSSKSASSSSSQQPPERREPSHSTQSAPIRGLSEDTSATQSKPPTRHIRRISEDILGSLNSSNRQTTPSRDVHHPAAFSAPQTPESKFASPEEGAGSDISSPCPSRSSIGIDLLSQATIASRTSSHSLEKDHQSTNMSTNGVYGTNGTAHVPANGFTRTNGHGHMPTNGAIGMNGSSHMYANGAIGANGTYSPPLSPKSPFQTNGRPRSFTSSHASVNGFGLKVNKRSSGFSHKIGFVQEHALALRQRSMAELGAPIHKPISGVSYITFLEWVRCERLTTLPHKGSRWDKVLIRALYFAEQLHKFEQAVQSFALDSGAASTVAYGHAQLLLELGDENSEALDKVFSVFYKFAVSFQSVLRRSELLVATSEIREQLCHLYTDLIALVVDVAIKFYKTANGMTSGTVSLDIFELFGETIAAFRARQNTVIELIWDSQIENEDGEALDVKLLSRWLAPQDRVLAALTRDHSTFVDQQVEFTCLWFQSHLTKYLSGNDSFLLITGDAGHGKTTLAASIVERFQRPVSRKQYDTLFVTLSPDIPTTASPLEVAKSLLSQLLSLRVGNLALYRALSKAYHNCRATGDMKIYEDHLWTALADALTHSIEGSHDLVIVVDGLDEIADSKSASIQANASVDPAALIQRLADISQGRNVRLIALGTAVKMPSSAKGAHLQIARDDVRDDLHAVALSALVHNHHWRAQRPFDQEKFLDRIIQAVSGSFLRTILICDILNTQKSPEALMKSLEAVEKQKPTTADLVSQLFSSLNATDEAKTVLSWILAAERPLTVDEINTLFTIDVQRGTTSNKRVQVTKILESIKPLLVVHERIVRLKHPLVHSALHDLAAQNKVPIPLKDSETDLLLRVLTYAKLTMREKPEPLFHDSDPCMGDQLYQKHNLLEYTVRYWILHLQQSPLAPKSVGDSKPSTELQQAMPDTTQLPILEEIVWEAQLPVPQAIDLHKLAGTVRRSIFGEDHPSVLQTYITIAKSYLMLSRPADCARYFYWATTISRKIFSDIHPLTLDCAIQFLNISASLKATSRTEIMTQRESILVILINIYERQYGASSKMVIETRKLLMELYTSISEEDKAAKVFHLIREATIHQHGSDSHQARALDEHMTVTLGPRKDEIIQSYDWSFFHGDEDKDDSAEKFEITSIIAYIRRAEVYVSRKEWTMAEKTYVELWTEVSSKCRSVQSIEWHEKNIEIATAYSSFLKSQKRTSESASVLSCTWQQYEHSQLSFAQSIVSRLTTVAKEMRSIGMHTQALSIFKYASSYFKSVRQEESSISREINQQMSETSTELVKESLNASSNVTTTTTTVSETVFRDVFFSIMQSSKTVDFKTMALAKQLTAKYIQKKDFTAAINVITATLERIWSSFLASSIHDVTMTSTFTQESMELVEQLAECYLQTRQLEKVADIYGRMFRAVLLAEKVEKTVFDRSRDLLIGFYDKHGYSDKAISIYQEILVSYRSRLGPAHELTIQTLYTLARRCQKHPRQHPYAIDYYLQIIQNLNKDSEVCHPAALDAIIVVTTTYWEDRRYAEAISIYRVLWKTFITKTKDHKIFNDSRFVQTLYDHYFQCLEETKSSWSELHQVTQEYRQTVTAVFGAESAIAVEATLLHAQVTERSEEHASQAIALYEDFNSRSKTVTTRTTSFDTSKALSSLYVKQVQSSSLSSMKSETIQRALSISEKSLEHSISAHGYSHEYSLNSLREISMLYSRQQKSEVAVKKLTIAVSEIITKETSSQKQIESAASIASTFRSIEQTSKAHKLVQELHRQICAKDTRYVSEWSFDLTSRTRSSLAFLASLQYSLRKDLNQTFTEIMSDLTMEYIYFEQFHLTLYKNDSLTNILLAASPLRFFLRRNDQQEMINVVEEQAVSLFVKRDAQDLEKSIQTKESPRIFIIGILDHLGSGRNKNFNRSVILSSNNSVAKLTKAQKFPEAYDIAYLGFLFASKHDGYNDPRAISMGFQLASLLVGRKSGDKCPDPALRKKMLELSNRIVKRILDICKTLNINFARIQLYELSHLSILLGEQQDYETLEHLLTTLWNTRDAQRTWPASILLNLGRRLICARYLAGHPIKAIRLAEDIAYNMRRAHGPRAPVTIETYELLAQLYTSTGLTYQNDTKTAGLAAEYFKKAIGVHEDILRLVVHEQSGNDTDTDSDDDLDTAAALLAREGIKPPSNYTSPSSSPSSSSTSSRTLTINPSPFALKHLHLLKLSHQRLGAWPKPYAIYERLNARLFRVFGEEKSWKGVEGTEKWDVKGFGNGKAESRDGGFEGVEMWGFGGEEEVLEAQRVVGQVVDAGWMNGGKGLGLGIGGGGVANLDVMGQRAA